MEGQLFYDVSNSAATSKVFINLNKDLSLVNSKNMEHTTRDGHVKGYMCNVSLVGASGQLLTYKTAPNTWKFRNSFRKFHAYRKLMFENAGVTQEEMGRYGKTMRPYLTNGMYQSVKGLSSSKTLTPTSGFATLYNGGEWTYSRLATVPLYEAADPAGLPGPEMGESELTVADEWELAICGTNVVDVLEDETSGQYQTVGMIHSYNLDRQDVVTPTTAGETIQGPENPLAALIASGNQAAGEILDITNEQELERPPYDEDDGGDSVETIVALQQKIPTVLGIVKGSMFVPAGLLQIDVSGSGNYNIMIDVVAEVLCKDLA